MSQPASYVKLTWLEQRILKIVPTDVEANGEKEDEEEGESKQRWVERGPECEALHFSAMTSAPRALQHKQLLWWWLSCRGRGRLISEFNTSLVCRVSEFQDSQGYTGKHCLEKQNKTKQNKTEVNKLSLRYCLFVLSCSEMQILMVISKYSVI